MFGVHFLFPLRENIRKIHHFINSSNYFLRQNPLPVPDASLAPDEPERDLRPD